MWYCLKIGAKPWRFSQVNAAIYDEKRHIFSKLDIEKKIPKKWRPKTFLLDKSCHKSWEKQIEEMFMFPVFLKPEWGQNSQGIFRADNIKSLRTYLAVIKKKKTPYFVQEAIPGLEIDIYFLNDQLLSITQMHDFNGEEFPINGIYNQTQNMDISHDFSPLECQKIQKNLKTIVPTKLARFGCKADSYADLIAGKFKIIEINLFLPFPLNLLDKNVSWIKRYRFMKSFAHTLAVVVKSLPPTSKNIFWPMVKRHFQLKN